jgi:hypothetical protein
LKKIAPSVVRARETSGARGYYYQLPAITLAREEFAQMHRSPHCTDAYTPQMPGPSAQAGLRCTAPHSTGPRARHPMPPDPQLPGSTGPRLPRMNRPQRCSPHAPGGASTRANTTEISFGVALALLLKGRGRWAQPRWCCDRPGLYCPTKTKNSAASQAQSGVFLSGNCSTHNLNLWLSGNMEGQR